MPRQRGADQTAAHVVNVVRGAGSLGASPAAVCRCGMVYLEPMHLRGKPLIATWAELFHDRFPRIENLRKNVCGVFSVLRVHSRSPPKSFRRTQTSSPLHLYAHHFDSTWLCFAPRRTHLTFLFDFTVPSLPSGLSVATSTCPCEPRSRLSSRSRRSIARNSRRALASASRAAWTARRTW